MKHLLSFFLFLTIIFFNSSCNSSPKDQKPNVILIVVDDMGWTDLSCFGSDYYETPHIDRWSETGVKFTSAYAACAVCSPTRSAIVTGKYPTQTGITDWIHHNDNRVPEAIKTGVHPTGFDPARNRPMLTPVNKFWLEHEEETIAELLKPAGYASAYIGKWHLGPENWYPDHQGFDYNIGGCQFGQPPSFFDPYGNKHYDSIPTLPPRKKGEYLTDREADEALQFIRNHKDEPFFLYLAHYAVHSPLQAPPELIDKYKNKAKTNQKIPVYAAMVEAVDHAAGKITALLEELELSENTLIIFTSDNGGASHFDATDNAPLRLGKGFPYEGGIRVPAIVNWPAKIKAGQSDEPIISMDILPTICEAAGVDLPEDLLLDGYSLLPSILNDQALDRQTFYWHFPHYWWGTNVKPYSIIRDGDWKLIRYYQSGRFELFNLKEDLGEKNDLAAQMPDKVAVLDEKLAEWLEETGALLPVVNPEYKKRD